MKIFLNMLIKKFILNKMIKETTTFSSLLLPVATAHKRAVVTRIKHFFYKLTVQGLTISFFTIHQNYKQSSDFFKLK